MRILAGYLPASSGTARIAGYDVHEDSIAVRQRIGYLPEVPPLYPEMTVEGFLYFVTQIKGVPAGDRALAVNSALKRCNLEEKRKVLIRKLSKGFRQRVGIAQALVHDPPAIILDEPTVGLDPRQIIEMRKLIKSLAGSHTIILSTHILPEVSMTCSRVVIINRGKIVVTNTPENLEASLVEGSGYEVEAEGDPETALERLRAVPGIRLVESMAMEHLRDNRSVYRIVSATGAEPGREIATALVSSGLGLCEMRRTRASLEDVFLQLTTSEKAIADDWSRGAEEQRSRGAEGQRSRGAEEQRSRGAEENSHSALSTKDEALRESQPSSFEEGENQEQEGDL